jgi:hypothetical protein
VGGGETALLHEYRRSVHAHKIISTSFPEHEFVVEQREGHTQFRVRNSGRDTPSSE